MLKQKQLLDYIASDLISMNHNHFNNIYMNILSIIYLHARLFI